MADRVANMVCSACARVGGQEHAPGCPVPRGSNFDDYGAGWIAARDALLPPLGERISELESDVHALVAGALELCGRERDGTWVVYGDEHGDTIRKHLLPVVREIVERKRG